MKRFFNPKGVFLNMLKSKNYSYFPSLQISLRNLSVTDLCGGHATHPSSVLCLIQGNGGKPRPRVTRGPLIRHPKQRFFRGGCDADAADFVLDRPRWKTPVAAVESFEESFEGLISCNDIKLCKIPSDIKLVFKGQGKTFAPSRYHVQVLVSPCLCTP